jgi:hypothetical protein
MGKVFQSCTKSSYNTQAVGAGGIASNLTDIDDATLQVIKNGIGEAHRAQLKQVV